ncbi:unnamed protein product, partial [Ilex paraguariensis]
GCLFHCVYGNLAIVDKFWPTSRPFQKFRTTQQAEELSSFRPRLKSDEKVITALGTTTQSYPATTLVCHRQS